MDFSARLELYSAVLGERDGKALMRLHPRGCRLGHNLGLGHAGITSPTLRLAGASPAGDGDYHDWGTAMGNSGVAGLCYNLPQQTFLGCECVCVRF